MAATNAAKKTATQIDAGLQQIADWRAWFVAGHTARLADVDLTPDARALALEEITRVAAAVTARMRDDYLSNRSRGTQQP